jgi:hypothetical protein
MVAQKGLRFHLGDQKYSEFERRFLEKTARYPGRNKANKRDAGKGTKARANTYQARAVNR